MNAGHARTYSMQARVLAWVLGAAAVLWVATAAFTWAQARHEVDELLDAHLAQAAALLVAQQATDLDDGHGVDAPLLHRYATRVTFQVFHDGRLAMRSANAPAEPMIALAGASAGFHTVQLHDATWRVFAARGSHDGVAVLVGEAVSARSHILQSILGSTLGPLLAGLPLLALALWWGVRRGLVPLGALGRALAARGPGELAPVRLAGAPVEIEPVLDALNALLARIAALMESERRFIADAAHELRTPLAAIRAQAQVALGETDPALRATALQAAVDGCDRAARLADQLLALSRAEATHDVGTAPVDLAVLARDVLAQLGALAVSRGQDMELSLSGAVTVRGDGALLAALIRNVAENALRHGPDGARVRCTIRREGEQVVLTVEDSGAGVDEALLARLGERFLRAPGTPGSGSGLGLSIVQRIAQLHRATVSYARSPRLGGLQVTVTFAAAR